MQILDLCRRLFVTEKTNEPRIKYSSFPYSGADGEVLILLSLGQFVCEWASLAIVVVAFEIVTFEVVTMDVG